MKKENISGLHFKNGQLANNLSIEEATPVEGETHSNKGNWSIIEDTGDGTTKTFTNTTLNTSASAEWNTGTDSLITGATIAEDNKVENPAEVADAKIEYGKNYKVIDTDGNIVELSDVASAKTLQKVATEAGKHTTVTVNGDVAAPTDGTYTDGNLQLKQTVTDGQTRYDVKLNDNISLGEGKITLNGAPETEDADLLNVDNTLVVGQDGTTTITADDAGTIGTDTKVTVNTNGVTFEGYGNGSTIIDGQTIQAGGVFINDNGNGQITRLTNTDLNDPTFATVGRAATEEQLSLVKSEAEKHTTVTVNGDVTAPTDGTYTDGNLQLKQTVTDGQTRYDVKLNDNISLGEGKITLNGAPETEDADLLNVDNTLVVGQDGTTTITADDAETMGTDTKVTVGTNGVTFEGLGNGTTFIDGQTIHAGGIDINGEETKGTITKLTNTDWDPNGTYTMGRAATEEQLQKASAASKTTISDGKNTNVTWEDKEDGHRDYKVNLNDNVTLGEGSSQITLNGKPEGDAALMSVGDKLVVEQDGTTTITADDAETMGTDTKVTVGTNGVTFEGLGNGTTFIDGQTIHAGGIDINGEETKGTITKLTNTDWDPNGTYTMGRAATEEQLQKASAASKTTISDGKNTNVTWEDKEDGHRDYKVNLNDNVYLGGNRTAQNSNIKLDGEKGNIQVGSNIALLGEDGRAIIGGVDISTTFDDIGKKSATITGLSNTTWDADKVVIDRAATEGQLQMVSDKVTAGWTATDDNGNKINVNPDNHPTLNFASGKNITVSAVNDEVEVSLNDNINLNDRVYINGKPAEGNNTIVDIKSGDTSKEESIFAVEDKGNGSISIGGIDVTNVDGPYLAVGDGKLKFYKDGGLATGNETGTFSVRPDGDLEINGKNSSFNVDAETGNVNAINNSGSAIMMNDDSVALNASGNGVAISDEGILLNTNSNGTSVSIDNRGTTFTNTNTGETTNINGDIITTDTVKGLSNTTWDDELATQVANSEELQGTAATQGQLQQAVSEVAEVANAGWNAKAGGNTINVKPNETLNFEGDGNITVSATGGTSNELKFGLNDNITLGDKAGQKTSTSLTLYTDPTLKEVTRIGEDGNPETVKVTGYIPESYIDDQERVDNFISTHGGFMMYATNTSGKGVFGITTDGMVHAKDVISYMPNSDSTSKDKILKYSLNDIGDIVTQIAHGQYDKTGMEYTLISDFSSQADKDKPFQPEEGERTIGLAVREDGAVVVGAVVNEDGYINDSGIRINAEKRVNKDGTTSSDNMATITGLENTTWTPPEPEQSQIATFADDTPKTSRAATESQLNDLYSSVVGYNTYMTKDGSVNIDYGHVTLKGEKKYTVTTDANGVKSYSGGVILDNVAYASGEEGNEAVNVDYLNDAIKDAVKDGPVASNEKHLDTSKTYTPDKTTGKITINEVDGTGAVTGNQLVINDVASKAELDSLKTGVGDRNYNNVTDTTPIANGDSVTTAIGKLNNSIKGVTQDVINNSISGGHVDETGKVVLEKGEGENKSEVTTDIQLTDSEVSGVTLEKDTETGKNVLTITSTDKYDKNKTSSVTVSGLEIASTDDIKDVTGVASSEDLKDAYKDADKDGNATTEYITDSESMVEADVALDHAIQDVANTSYANDMVLSNRIDSVEKRLGNVEERIDKVGAMAAAIANLRTMGFDPEAPTEIAIGVGQYKSETGIAIGVFHYPNQDFMLSASLSSSGDELMGGIGATWKLGRKSAAERAKDEEARHLEQAEEMKKLAQQEKVKAQAQRHAKLLAERQQASQKNA